MTAVRHPWRHGIGEANRAGCRLGFGRGDDLEDIGPVEMLVGVAGQWSIASVRVDDESIVGMDESGMIVCD